MPEISSFTHSCFDYDLEEEPNWKNFKTNPDATFSSRNLLLLFNENAYFRMLEKNILSRVDSRFVRIEVYRVRVPKKDKNLVDS